MQFKWLQRRRFEFVVSGGEQLETLETLETLEKLEELEELEEVTHHCCNLLM